MLSRIVNRAAPWDILVIGGGATGMGVAVDAASRGLSVLLLEREDFGKGTSSRSTKMVHGGVRYLEQGNIPLVMEALKERGILRQNAPHLVHDMSFVVPNYSWWEAPFYGAGLKAYDLLAGRYGFGRSQLLSRDETLARLPTIRTDGLKGGVIYHDGQFDDSRLLVHLAMTAVEQGAAVINYMPVTGFVGHEDSGIEGVIATDSETGRDYTIPARQVINATGIFTDETRAMSADGLEPMIAPSQGVHLMLDRSFLPGDSAILVPHTDDGRVLFAIPWHGKVLIGTTDTPVEGPAYEPAPQEAEIEFLLATAGHYLAKSPAREDILSVFTGIRPLVRSGAGKTSALSRGHVLRVDDSRLLTIVGGKWTTYRAMAEATVDKAIELAHLPTSTCKTEALPIHGFLDQAPAEEWAAVYGSDAQAIRQLAIADPPLGERLDSRLPYIAAEIVWAIRNEMARTLDDLLARRLRALFIDARAAIEIAPAIAAMLASELGRDDGWITAELARFNHIAKNYLPIPQTE
jgi:glycerol-3-phosphate dehydrogenase